MEDSRFIDISKIKKKEVNHNLHWFMDDKDYFSNELLGVYNHELDLFKEMSEEAFRIFEEATQRIIDNNDLSALKIPRSFHDTIKFSWENRNSNPFLFGRFDINGGIDKNQARIIEFNADTCSTLPETILWQQEQLKRTGGKSQFNNLFSDITDSLRNIRQYFIGQEPHFMASSLGYIEDLLNCNIVIDAAKQAGFKCNYLNLDQVVFSEEGIFYETNSGDYQKIDVWYKLVPWDWMFNEEPELAKLMSNIVENQLAVVLNPAYTTIWQNKLFLPYITEHFSNSVIAETYLKSRFLTEFVEKPIYGRLGENIEIVGKEKAKTKGDFGTQVKIYQKYYPLEKDEEKYYYQTGMFYTNKPSALNFRAEEKPIISDDCEFMSHYII